MACLESIRIGTGAHQVILVDSRAGIFFGHDLPQSLRDASNLMDGAQFAAGVDQVQVLDAVAGQDSHPVA